MIDGNEKRNRQLAFELQNSHVCEKRSKQKPASLNTDKTFLWLAQNILTKQLNHTTIYLSTPCEITQTHTFASLISLSTTTHNLLTFNTSQISSNNPEKLSLLADTHGIHTSGLFSYTRVIQVPGCRVTRSADQRRP